MHTINTNSITLTLGTSEVTTNLNGATVVSWKVDGVEKLFVSKLAVLDGTKAIRGGMYYKSIYLIIHFLFDYLICVSPLVFPHFGLNPKSTLPQHGFARLSR